MTEADSQQILEAIAALDEKFTERLDTTDRRLGRMEAKVDAIHYDVKALRSELVGVIDPRFRPVGV